MLCTLCFAINIVKNDIGSKCNCSYPKARKHTREHGTVGEDRMFAPSVSLGPWITEKRQIGHAVEYTD